MTNSDNQPEQSMEEIIASIRKMIAEEPEPASTPARSITEQTPSSPSALIPAGANLTTFFDQSSSPAAVSPFSEASSSQPETEPESSPQASQSQTAWPFAERPFEPDTNFPEHPPYPADQGLLYSAPQDMPQNVQRHEQHAEASDALPPLSPFSELPAINPAGGHEDESQRLHDLEDRSDSQFSHVPENDDGQSDAAVFGVTSMPEHPHYPADQDFLYPASQDVPQDVQRDEQHFESPDALHRLSPFPEHPFDSSAGGHADEHEDESERGQDFEDGPAEQSGSIPENDDGQFNRPLSGATAMPAESGEPADHAALSDIAKPDAALSETLDMAPVFPSDNDAEHSAQSCLEDMTQSAETGEQEDLDDFSDIAKADIELVDPLLTVSASLADNDDDFCDQFAYGDMAVPAENSDQVEHHKPDAAEVEAAEAEAASPTSEPVTDREVDEQDMPAPVPQPDGLGQEISDHTETLQAEQFVGSLQKITEEKLESIGFIRLSPEKSEIQPSEHSGQPIAEQLNELDDVVDHPDASQASAGLHESSVQSVSAYAADDVPVGDREARESMEETSSAEDAEDEDRVPNARVGTQVSVEEEQSASHDEPSIPVHEESLAGAVKSADQPSGTGAPQPQIEAALSDLIRPIIHRWLEDNVPVIIDTAVKKNKMPKDDSETQ